jgi:hypothetical protein
MPALDVVAFCGLLRGLPIGLSHSNRKQIAFVNRYPPQGGRGTAVFDHFSDRAVLSVQRRAGYVRKSAYDKKYWNATARYLFDSRWNHYAISHCHRLRSAGSSGPRHRYSNFGRQVANDSNFSLRAARSAGRCGAPSHRFTTLRLPLKSATRRC